MSAFTGTGTLLRLALRRDRIKLPLWIVGIAGMFAASVASTIDLYGSSMEAKVNYALTTAPSIVSRVFGGPINGPDIGAIVLNETFLFTVLAAAFMSTLAVVRHTRQNEETGRSELIGSAVVGLHASLTAALIVTFGANIILGAFLALALVGNGLPAVASLVTGAAVACAGVVFATAAAVMAQISDSARGANSLAALVIGVAFLLRAVGDGIGALTHNGMAIISAWPAWLSPIGWAQQLHPFTEQNWGTFGLLGGLCIALVGTAFFLTDKRDVGLGMLPVRQGPAAAPPALLSPFGLAWRLQKGILKGWAVAIVVLGATYGLVAKEFQKLFEENESIAELMKQLGGADNINDALLSALFFFMALTIAAYSVQALQRLRSEEAGGQLEPVLATSVSRPRWMLSHMACAFIGVSVLTLFTGLSMGTTYVLATGQPPSEILGLASAAFIHMPAILALSGFAILAFSLLPRMAIGLAWGGFGFCLLIGQFGAALKLPQWVLDVSPFTHTPSVPAEAVSFSPVVTLLAVAIALSLAGLTTFRRRDLTTA